MSPKTSAETHHCEFAFALAALVAAYDSLDQVSRSVGHAGPEEETALLVGRVGAGVRGGDGAEDLVCGRTGRDGGTPAVGALEELHVW